MSAKPVAGPVRLYVEHPLGAAQSVPLTQAQAHYLFGVMRLAAGDGVRLFNGQDGEWAAEVVEAGRKGGVLVCDAQTAPQGAPPDLWLLFAPVKKARTDFIVEKAVEMGAARICPVTTAYTNSDRIRRDRMAAHAIEAAEQCGATYAPEVADLARLDKVLDDWPAERRLMFCDERLRGAVSAAEGEAHVPWAILIGPEGGFSMAERARIAALPGAQSVSLGPRILRAETAAIAAMTLWQLRYGDWSDV